MPRTPPPRLRAALAALTAALTSAGCASEPPPVTEAPGPHELTLETAPEYGLALAVEIAGATHRLAFDPGAGMTLLTPEKARELGCQPWGRVVLQRPGGEALALRRCGEMSLSLGPVTSSAATAVLDPVPASLRAAGLGGVASLQTLGPRPVTLDLSARRIVLESDASLKARTAEMRPVEARLSRDAGGLATRLFLGVGTARGPLWLLAADGSGGRVAVAPHTLSLLGADPEAPEGSEVALSLELPGLGRVERRAVVRDGPWDGVLDAATLEQVVLTVDLRDGRAWARWSER